MLRRRVVVVAAWLTLFTLLVPPRGVEAAPDTPDVIWGSISYQERGPGASLDGIANAFIMGSFAPVVGARLGRAQQVVFELLQNPALAEAMGTDMGSISDKLRGDDLVGRPPIRASYGAHVSFQLEADRDGTSYHLKSGTISWSSDNHTRLSANGMTLADDFSGGGVEALDPSSDVIDLTFEDRGGGSRTWTIDVEVDHTYRTVGESSWTWETGTISLVRTGSKVELGATTLFGPVPVPPLPPDLFADQVKTVVYAATGKVSATDDQTLQILETEAWTNILEGSQVARVEIRDDCSPVIVRPDPPRLVFDEATPGTISTTAVLQGPVFAQQAARWVFPEVPFEADYQPKDLAAPRVDFFWRGLPERNEQLGEYTVEVDYADPAVAKECGPVRPLDLGVFFPIDAKNNPGGKDPNWFYYWMQTSASNGIGDVRVVDCAGNRTFGEYNYGDTYIRLCDPETYQPDIRAADAAPIAYIDSFATVLIHENRHRENYLNWWRAGYGLKATCVDWDHDGKDDPRPGCVMDTDRDQVPDAVEPGQTAPDGHNLGLKVGAKYSCKLGPTTVAQLSTLGIHDEECTAYWEEIRWQIGSARSEDWAAPGTQWGGTRP